ALQPGMAGLVGLAAIGLLASTVRGLVPLASQWGYSIDPAWGYRTLMLGWGMYSLLVVLTTWWVASVRTLPGAQGPPQALIRAASGWVSAAGLLAVLLGLKAAFFHRLPEDLLWAAAAIALASAAGAAMSVWRRREGWAFAAAPGVNLAASLVVWYYQRELGFQEWWVLLVQANVIASAAVALVWLAARKRLYELRELTLGTSPLLAVQTLLAVAGNALLVAVPVARLLEMPASLPGWAAQLAEPPGWIALGLAAGAAAWYLRQVAPRSLFHAVGGLGLALGVLITCSTAGAGPRFAPADWLSYHVLFTSWAAVGLAALAVGLLGRNLRLAEQTDPNRRGPALGSLPVFPSPVVQAWVTGIGTVVVGLALLYMGKDPVLPWWSARAVLAAGVMAGVLAMWLRRGAYVFISGLLVNVAGTVIWMAWGPWNFAAVLYTNVLCLAVGSCVWTLLRPAHPEGVPGIKLGGRALPFAHLAVQAGLAVLGVLVVISAVFDVRDVHRVPSLHDPATYQLGWLALAAASVATTLLLWDRTARFPLKAWYSIGLIAVGMALGVRELSPRVFCWTAGHELAGFVLLAALLARLLSRMKPAWQALRIPGHDNRFPNDWLPQVQAVVAGLALVLGAWISIDFAFDEISRAGVAWITGRTAGPLSACALLAAGVLIAGQSSGRWRVGWQCGTIALGALVLAEWFWAWLPPAWGVPWLHRSVILMAAAVVMALVSQFGLARILPAGSGWIASGRRMLPVLGGVALVLLALVLVQEAFLFEPPDGTPMAMPAIVVVAAALAGLTVASLALALFPRLEPFGLSDRGRTVYVYAAEVLAALMGVHLWLTVPWLFRLGIVEEYWMLIVMAVAFGGAGLSELFHRRGLPVLSEPLERTAVLLPLAPAVIFWLPITPLPSDFADASLAERLFAGASPAVWFFAAAFYGVMAVTRRSKWWLPILSLVAANVGLWVAWQQQDWFVWDRPQLWLIPVGLSLLVAEYLNYDRLTKTQSSVVRYVALSLIYVSSSTEFLGNLGGSPWRPVVLILLSVLGVLAGIVLRVRSFVILGITFLALVIVTMICHAAFFGEKQMWIFWVF
ncbi:MAG: hypothetical protein ABIK89_15820, partial [Planctomycetota bacterium]